MYTKCRLIHADLSEYNMLWHDGNIYFIDVSQAVEPIHPQGLEFLLRDCSNVCNFFSKTKLVDDVMTPQQLFNYVTGLGIHADSDQEFLIHVSSINHMTSYLNYVIYTCSLCLSLSLSLSLSLVEKSQTEGEARGCHSLKNRLSF